MSISQSAAAGAAYFGLAHEALRLTLTDSLDRVGRSARTLIKDGPLRVTIIALADGGKLASHHAPGPITVHVLSGTLFFRAAGKEWRLQPGDLLSLGAGEEHEVASDSGAVFLLTIAMEPEGEGSNA